MIKFSIGMLDTKARELFDAISLRAGVTPIVRSVHVCRQRRGRWYEKQKLITVPLWAWNKSAAYREWYMAHEMAHALDGAGNHGPDFQAWLLKLTPDCAYLEYGYKPRRAAAAGIPKRRKSRHA